MPGVTRPGVPGDIGETGKRREKTNNRMSNEPIIKPLLSVSEAAILLGVNRNRAYKLLRGNVIPGAVVKLPGSEWLVKRAIIEQWLATPTA
jgi:excisionase family DNA binding protein